MSSAHLAQVYLNCFLSPITQVADALVRVSAVPPSSIPNLKEEKWSPSGCCGVCFSLQAQVMDEARSQACLSLLLSETFLLQSYVCVCLSLRLQCVRMSFLPKNHLSSKRFFNTYSSPCPPSSLSFGLITSHLKGALSLFSRPESTSPSWSTRRLESPSDTEQYLSLRKTEDTLATAL